MSGKPHQENADAPKGDCQHCGKTFEYHYGALCPSETHIDGYAAGTQFEPIEDEEIEKDEAITPVSEVSSVLYDRQLQLNKKLQLKCEEFEAQVRRSTLLLDRVEWEIKQATQEYDNCDDKLNFSNVCKMTDKVKNILFCLENRHPDIKPLSQLYEKRYYSGLAQKLFNKQSKEMQDALRSLIWRRITNESSV